MKFVTTHTIMIQKSVKFEIEASSEKEADTINRNIVIDLIDEKSVTPEGIKILDRFITENDYFATNPEYKKGS